MPSLPVEARHFSVLGVRVDAVQIPDVIDWMTATIERHRPPGFIAVTGMHGITEAQEDPSFKAALNRASLVVPDGTPLVWLARREGFPLSRRVYGPELFDTFCARTGGRFRHFFYGGAPGVADALAKKLQARHGIVVAGTFTPPYRPLTGAEEEQLAQTVRRVRPDVIWVGLSTPHQERWMLEHSSLGVPVAVGVGAAFDFLSGRKDQAPVWMQEHGLEWFYRLAKEPRRLWRRYLVGGAKFFFWLFLDRLGLRRFDLPTAERARHGTEEGGGGPS